MEDKYLPEAGEEVASAQGLGKKPQPIVVGPCGPRGCPPPREIVCIKTKKVYQECKQVEPIERVKVFDIDIPLGAVEVECIRVTPGVISCEDAEASYRGKKKCGCECEVGEGTVTLEEIRHFPVRIVLEFYDRNGLSLGRQTGWAKIDIPEKTVLLSRAGEPQLKCEVDVFLTCLLCLIEEEEPNTVLSENQAEGRHPCYRKVICCINKIILFKLLAEVQLLIPSYGFCPDPPVCEEEDLAECPGAVEDWPPYPPEENGIGCKSCK